MGIQVIANAGTVSREETYNQIMFEIQKRMVDIETNKEMKKPIENELADMVILINKLSEIENVDETTIRSRRSSIEQIFK